MALVFKDRVKETSTTSGTGTLTLSGAVSGYQSFSVIGDGNTTYYSIVDTLTGDWETGIGTYTSSGTTLARTTVLESSNSNSAVNLAGNVVEVFVTYVADKAVSTDTLPPAPTVPTLVRSGPLTLATSMSYAHGQGSTPDLVYLEVVGTDGRKYPRIWMSEEDENVHYVVVSADSTNLYAVASVVSDYTEAGDIDIPTSVANSYLVGIWFS